MVFAQFYNRGVITKTELFEACGDRSVVIYDGRLSKSTIRNDARRECIKRGYAGFAIFRGETFTRCSRISEIERV